ncbi:MAG: lysylphosphatidylglycerol synthase domain-containing protein [Bacillota bacterium]
MIIARGKVPSFLERKNDQLAGLLKSFCQHGQRLGQQPLVMFKVILWSATFQLTYIAVNYAIFQGLRISQAGLGVAAIVVPATAALAMIPVGVNGYGVREGAYVFLLAPYSVERAAAFTASVLFAFLVSLCSLWGGIIWLRIEQTRRTLYVGDAGIQDCQGSHGERV